jgi:sugar O-acyltransferase (sialic acid O-acetyltransferase NeuD family)
MVGEIIIVGAGAHARVVFDILRAEGKAVNVVAFVDVEGRGELAGKTVFDRPVIDGIEAAKEFSKGRDVTAVIGHGNNSKRKELLPQLEEAGFLVSTAVHPTAIISPDVEIGKATTISAGAILVTGAKIGKGCIINTGATVDHDCEVGDFAQVAPGANLAGRVKIGSEAFIGIGSVVIQNLVVGEGSVVGAGAAVVRDVPDKCLVIGVPARVRKKL